MRTLLCTIALGLFLVTTLGCGDTKRASKESGSREDATVEDGGVRAERMAFEGDEAIQDHAPAAPCGAGKAKAMGMIGGQADQKAAGGPKAAPQPQPRKIVYTADVKMVVDDLPSAEEQLKRITKDYKGFVAQSALTGSTGTRRTGTWRIRVPVDGFEGFMTEIVKLGVPEINKTDSQDVSDQFYDLEARITNRKKEEETLRVLLEKTTDKIENYLAVRDKLSAVREDIDVQEGRLRRLANLSALSTVNVTLREEKDYVPPQAPTFGSTITNTFSSSIDVLKSVGKGLVLFVVALTPWLPVILIVALPVWVIWRRRRLLTAVPAASAGVPTPPASPTN